MWPFLPCCLCWKVFCGFQEGKLVHPPTYKLVRGDAFDEQNRRIYSDERSRVPAWTDRILYKTLQGEEYHKINGEKGSLCVQEKEQKKTQNGCEEKVVLEGEKGITGFYTCAEDHRTWVYGGAYAGTPLRCDAQVRQLC